MKKIILTYFCWLIIFLSIIIFLFLKKQFSPASSMKNPRVQETFLEISSTPTPKIVTLAFAGEMIFARTVASKINEYKDYKYPFYQVKPALEKADLRFATLEAPLFGKNTPCSTECMVFVGDEDNIIGLKFSDINVVSLAANHIMDGNEIGLKKTIEILDSNKIAHVGAGITSDNAHQPVIKEIKGIKVGFLGYNDVPPKEYQARENKAGSAWLEEKNLVSDIKKLKDGVDILIVGFHWGTEYTAKPNSEQIYFAHLAIDYGADLIIGDHPHFIQSIEFYKDKPIFYSLGNFVFDQMWSEETRKGIIVFTTYNQKTLEKIKIIPFKIFDYIQPRPMESEEKEKMLSEILSLSDLQSKEKLKVLMKKEF